MGKKANPDTEGNYLKAIYTLAAADSKKITLTTLAEALHINPPSVLDMMRKLEGKNLVRYDKKTGIKLTEEGNNVAESIVRKHKLWETFLMKKLGYGSDKVNEIAEQMENIDGPQLADKLDRFLGFPSE